MNKQAYLSGYSDKIAVATGTGRGQGNGPQGTGGTDSCTCPSCGATIPHQRGTPCNESKCPECGTKMTGMLSKEAGPFAAGLTGLGIVLDKLRVAALVAPAAVGASAGALQSIVTSPTGTDVKNLQKELYSSELEEMLAHMKRQQQLASAEKGDIKDSEREIHI